MPDVVEQIAEALDDRHLLAAPSDVPECLRIDALGELGQHGGDEVEGACALPIAHEVVGRPAVLSGVETGRNPLEVLVSSVTARSLRRR